MYKGPECSGLRYYKQNEKNDIKLNYKVNLVRSRMFWRNIKTK